MTKKQIDEESSEDEVIEDSEEDVSELEEEILDENQLDFSQIQNLENFSFGAPVLDQVEIAPNIIGLEHGLASEPIHKPLDEDSSDPFKYKIGGGKNDEATYVSSDAQMSNTSGTVDFSQIGRDEQWHRNQNTFFMSDHQRKNGDSGIEKYTVPENVDVNKEGRRDPFKRPEMKYDPKLPKH